MNQEDYLSLIHKLASAPIAKEQLDLLNQLAVMQKDPLTGLLDYRSFEGWLETQSRIEGEFSLIALGLDHLHELNLLSSWVIGDVVLCGLGGLIEKSLSELDSAGRISGSAFGVYLRETHPEKVRVWLEDILNKLGELKVPGADMLPDGKLTFSAGYMVVKGSPAHQAEQLISEARKRMEFARHQGGNVITMIAADTVARQSRALEVLEARFRKAGASDWLVGKLSEISPSGVALGCDLPLLARETLDLQLVRETRKELEVHGKVVWRRSAGPKEQHPFAIGVKLEKLNRDQSTVLQSLIEGATHE